VNPFIFILQSFRFFALEQLLLADHLHVQKTPTGDRIKAGITLVLTPASNLKPLHLASPFRGNVFFKFNQTGQQAYSLA
jgi:hypothetical protein